MPLSRKSELLAVVEAIPGTEKTSFVAGDAVEVLELDTAQDRTLIDRLPAGPTLSTASQAIGRGSVQVSCAVDLRGSGTATTLPEFDQLLQSCYLKDGDLDHLQFDATGLTQAVKVGDKLTGNTSNAVGWVMKNGASGDTTVLIYAVSGAFAAAETIASEHVGGNVGTTHASTPTVATQGKRYKPVSRSQLTFDMTGAWTGGNPSAGEVVKVTTTGGVVEGGVIFISQASSTCTAEYVWGTISNDSTLASTSGKTGTVAAAANVVQTEGKTLTLRPNRDGLARPVFGSFGTVTFSAEAGAQGRMQFEFRGKPGTPTDIGLQSGASYPTTVPPRFVGGEINLDGVSIPIKSFELALGNEVVMRADGNSSEGDMKAEITGRDPTLSIELDQVGVGTFDFWAKWSSSSTVAIGIQLGTTGGNTISLVARAAQISDISDGDQEGVATHTVGFRLRRSAAAGDDEFIVGHG